MTDYYDDPEFIRETDKMLAMDTSKLFDSNIHMTNLEKLLETSRALEEKRTPSPWEASDPNTNHFEIFSSCPTNSPHQYWVARVESENHADTDFIAHIANTNAKKDAIIRVMAEALKDIDFAYPKQTDNSYEKYAGARARAALAKAEELAK